MDSYLADLRSVLQVILDIRNGIWPIIAIMLQENTMNLWENKRYSHSPSRTTGISADF